MQTSFDTPNPSMFRFLHEVLTEAVAFFHSYTLP